MDNNNSTNNNFDNLENNNSFNNMVDNLGNSNNEVNNNLQNNTNNLNVDNNESHIINNIANVNNEHPIVNNSNIINNTNNVISLDNETVVFNDSNNIVNSNSNFIENANNVNNTINYDTNNNVNNSHSNNYKNGNRNNTGLYIIIIVLVALVIYLGITLIFNKSNDKTEYNGNDIVVKFNNGKIIRSNLYENLLMQNGMNVLLDMIDTKILEPLYPENNEMIKNVNKSYDEYINYYKEKGYTEEDFYITNGFINKNDFLTYLKLDYRRNKCATDYAKKTISSEEIKAYYDSNVFGDINSKHILVKINDTESKYSFNIKEADNLAKEIINQLNNGKTFDEVKEEYKDKITYEELGYQAFNANLESNYIKEMKDLEIGEYSEIPVTTSYGYSIIYKIDQKEKPSIDEVKEDILEILSEQKQSEDSNILYKALIELRKDNNVIFKDNELKDKYDNYVKLVEENVFFK